MSNYIYKIRNYYTSLKNMILKKYNRKYVLIILGILIIANLMLLTAYTSYAYYHSNIEFKLINAKVGNLYLEEYDYVQLIYLEEKDMMGNGLNKYYLVEEIPLDGYTFSKYNCDNNSILSFDDKTNTISVTIEKKDSCSIYMDVLHD